MSNMGIVEFLTARLDERQAAAEAAEASDPSPWLADTSDGASTHQRSGHGAGLVVAADNEALWDCEGSHTLCMTAATVRHVVLNDPARVLAGVAAQRAIVEDLAVTCRVRDEAHRRIMEARASGRIDSSALDEWNRAQREASIIEGVAQRLAAPDADHPDYNPAWAVS